MTVGQLIEKLSKYDPETRVFTEVINRDGDSDYIIATETITSNYAESTDEFYDDIDDAIENEDFNGHLEDVVIIA